MIYIGTDWHLWKYSKKLGKCIKRPEFDEIIKCAEDTLAEDDFMIYLGDLTDDEFASTEKLIGLLKNVSGYKIMVRGNNDTLDDSAYLAAGFDRVVDICTLGNLIFSHKPIYVGPLQINVHGHNHGSENELATPQNIDAWGGNRYLTPLEDVICGNEPDFSISITDHFWTAASPKHEVISGTIFDLEEYYINGVDNAPIDESVFRKDDELEVSDLLESIEENTIPKKEEAINYLRHIKYLTEAFFSEEVIGTSKNESLEMFIGKKPVTTKNGMVTLYHGSPEVDLQVIKATSLNVGTRLSSPRSSSFWADEPAVAIIMSIWKILASDGKLFDSVAWLMDFKKRKFVVSNSSKAKFNLGMKSKIMCLYVATIPIAHVGKGHDPDINEYSVDIDVYPHHHSLMGYKDFIKYVRFVSDDEFKRLIKSEDRGSGIKPRKVPFRDRLIYHNNFRITARELQAKMDAGEAIGLATFEPVAEAAYNKMIYDRFFADDDMPSPVNEVLLQDFEDAKDFETDDDVSRAHQDPDRQPTYRIRFRKKNRENPDVPTVDESVLTESKSVIDLSLPLMQPEMTEALDKIRGEFIAKGLLPSAIEEAARVTTRRVKPNVRKGEFDKAHRLQKAKKGKDPLAEASPFEGKFKSVKVDEAESMIVIKGIDFRKLMARLKNMYDTKKVSNLFDVEYTPWSLYLYNSEQIEKSQMKIKSVKVPLFFALELQQIFYDLADYYQLKYYAEIGNMIYKKTWISNVDKPVQRNEVNMNKLKGLFTIDPLPYQIGYVQEYFTITRCYNFDGHILTFKPGYGKTFTSVMIAEASPDVDQVVVVCPNTLKENWANEIRQYYKKYAANEALWLDEVYVSNNTKFNFSKGRNKWIIVNQESIPTIFDKVKSKNVMIIVDECQYFRNYETKRSGALLELKTRSNATEILMMSGTPIHATPDEALTALLMIDPMMTIDLAKKYKKAFSVDNTSLEKVIKARFGIVMYDVPTDVLKLPAKHEMEMKVKLDNDEKFFLTNVAVKIAEAYRKHYSSLGENAGQYRKDFVNVLEKYSSASRTDNTMYMQFIDDGASYLAIHESKHEFYKTFIKTYIYPNVPPESLKEVKAVIANYVYMSAKARGLAIGEVMPPLYNEVNMRLWMDNEDFFVEKIRSNLKKTLIFSPYVGVVNFIADRLKARGVGVVVVTGSVIKNRQDRLNEFMHSDMIDVLVATHNVAGTGLTLIEASQVFFFGVPFRSAEYDQAANRVYRIGQTSEVYIYKVLLDSSVDKVANITTRQNDIMEWSRNMSNAYTKGAKEQVEFDYDESDYSISESTAIQRACAQYDEYNLKPMFGKETLENEWDDDYDDAYSNDEVEFEESVNEDTLEDKMRLAATRTEPIFICLFHFSSVLSTLIAAVTKDEYSHATISFGTSLKNMYSFGKMYPNNPILGSFVHESLYGPTYDKVVKHAVYVVFVTPKEKETIKKNLDWFIRHSDRLRYNYEGLLKSLFKIPDEDGKKKCMYLCSEFVSMMLKTTGRDFISTPSNLVKPNDFQFYPWCYYLGSGKGRNYDRAAVDKKLREIIEKREAGVEAYLESALLESSKSDLAVLKDLNDKLNKFEYGLSVYGEKVVKKNTTGEDYDIKYHLASPEQFLKQEGGICWDFAAYEAHYLKTKFPKIKYTAWYIVFDAKPDYPTHTFLTVKVGDRYILPESSFKRIRGLWEAKSEKELINFVIYSMGQHTKGLLDHDFYLFKYDPTDSKTYGMRAGEFMSYVEKVGTEVRHIYSSSFDVRRAGSSTINESATFGEVKAILDRIPKEEHRFLYRNKYVDSPNTRFREVMYKNPKKKTGGAFLEAYVFPEDPDIAVISIGAEPEARGLGFTDKLVKKALTSLKKQGISLVIWRADNDNEHSIALAKRCGFVDKTDHKKNNDKRLFEMRLDESSLVLDESLIFSKDRIELNLSNWAPGKNNILYVTGLSGSGKTTYSEELEKAGEGVIFELDGLFLCYDSSNRGIIKRLEREDDDYKYHTPKSKVTRKQFKRWINSVIRYMHEDPETKYIVEGVQIYEYPGPLVDFAHDPVVIIGTSVLKSIYRRIKRAEGTDRRNQLRELKQMVGYYLDEHKMFTHFVKNATTNESSDSVPLVEASSFSDIKRILSKIPKEEHKYLYHNNYVDSPNTRFREVIYKDPKNKTGGAFIEAYVFPEAPDTAVLSIGAEPSARGFGLTDKLIKKCLASLKKQGISVVIWRADVSNKHSIELAKRSGFIDRSERSKSNDRREFEMVLSEASATPNDDLRVEKSDIRNENDKYSDKAVKLDFYDGKNHVGEASMSACDTEYGFLYDFEVFEKYRGNGYANKMMEYILSNYSVTDLTVSPSNTAAIKLYKKFGFKYKEPYYDKVNHEQYDWYKRPKGKLSESWEESLPTDVDGDGAPHIDGTHKDFMMTTDPMIGDTWDEYDDPIMETSTLVPLTMSDGVVIKLRPGNTFYYTAEDLRFFVAWLEESYAQLVRMLRTSEVDARAFANLKIIRAWMTKFYILANPAVAPDNKDYTQIIADNTDKLMRSYMERCVDMGISLDYVNELVEPIFNKKKEPLENLDIIDLANGEQGVIIHL